LRPGYLVWGGEAGWHIEEDDANCIGLHCV